MTNSYYGLATNMNIMYCKYSGAYKCCRNWEQSIDVMSCVVTDQPYTKPSIYPVLTTGPA